MPSGSLKKIAPSNNDLIFLVLSFAAGAFVASIMLKNKDNLVKQTNNNKNDKKCKLVEGMSCGKRKY